MSNPITPKLEQVFRAVFDLPADHDVQQIRQINFRKWDSLGHVLLISAIESEFATTVELEKSLKLTSFESIELYLQEQAS